MQNTVHYFHQINLQQALLPSVRVHKVKIMPSIVESWSIIMLFLHVIVVKIFIFFLQMLKQKEIYFSNNIVFCVLHGYVFTRPFNYTHLPHHLLHALMTLDWYLVSLLNPSENINFCDTLLYVCSLAM